MEDPQLQPARAIVELLTKFFQPKHKPMICVMTLEMIELISGHDAEFRTALLLALSGTTEILPPLNSFWAETAYKWQRYEHETISKVPTARGVSLEKLQPRLELNEEVMDAYLALIRETLPSTSNILLATSGLLRTDVLHKVDQEIGLAITNPVLAVFVIIPVKECGSWSLATLARDEKGETNVTVYDSKIALPITSRPSIHAPLVSWLLAQGCSSSLVSAGHNPQQNKFANDSGLFVLLGARLGASNRSMPSEADARVFMPTFRRRVFAELLAGSLDPDLNHWEDCHLRVDTGFRSTSDAIFALGAGDGILAMTPASLVRDHPTPEEITSASILNGDFFDVNWIPDSAHLDLGHWIGGSNTDPPTPQVALPDRTVALHIESEPEYLMQDNTGAHLRSHYDIAPAAPVRSIEEHQHLDTGQGLFVTPGNSPHAIHESHWGKFSDSSTDVQQEAEGFDDSSDEGFQFNDMEEDSQPSEGGDLSSDDDSLIASGLEEDMEGPTPGEDDPTSSGEEDLNEGVDQSFVVESPPDVDEVLHATNVAEALDVVMRDKVSQEDDVYEEPQISNKASLPSEVLDTTNAAEALVPPPTAELLNATDAEALDIVMEDNVIEQPGSQEDDVYEEPQTSNKASLPTAEVLDTKVAEPLVSPQTAEILNATVAKALDIVMQDEVIGQLGSQEDELQERPDPEASLPQTTQREAPPTADMVSMGIINDRGMERLTSSEPQSAEPRRLQSTPGEVRDGIMTFYASTNDLKDLPLMLAQSTNFSQTSGAIKICLQPASTLLHLEFDHEVSSFEASQEEGYILCGRNTSQKTVCVSLENPISKVNLTPGELEDLVAVFERSTLQSPKVDYVIDIDIEDVRADFDLPPSKILELPDDALPRTKNKFAGIHTPLGAVSTSYGTPFSAHIEDFKLCSVNHLLCGQPKLWVIISPSSRLQFEALVRKLSKSEGTCSQFVRHESIFVPISELKGSRIQYSIIMQHADEVIFTFPGAYHQGFNMGTNIAEAINYALVDGLGPVQGYVPCHRECNYPFAPITAEDMLSYSRKRPWTAPVAEPEGIDKVIPGRIISSGARHRGSIFLDVRMAVFDLQEALTVRRYDIAMEPNEPMGQTLYRLAKIEGGGVLGKIKQRVYRERFSRFFDSFNNDYATIMAVFGLESKAEFHAAKAHSSRCQVWVALRDIFWDDFPGCGSNVALCMVAENTSTVERMTGAARTQWLGKVKSSRPHCISLFQAVLPSFMYALKFLPSLEEQAYETTVILPGASQDELMDMFKPSFL